MTELLNAEFEDETGTTRRLTREEILTYVNVIAGAGNETTTRLIGWAGKVLAEHPDQRRELVDDPSLIPNAIEELLRFEPPAPHVGRYVARDVELYGQTVPEGSVDAVPGRIGEPRRPALSGRRPLRHPPRRRPAPHVRLRHPLLPRRRARPARGPRRARRGAEAVPRVGGRSATTPGSPRPRPCAAGRRFRSSRRDAREPARTRRRRYDSPVRRQRAAETRERIIVGRRRAPPRLPGLELARADRPRASPSAPA